MWSYAGADGERVEGRARDAMRARRRATVCFVSVGRNAARVALGVPRIYYSRVIRQTVSTW